MTKNHTLLLTAIFQILTSTVFAQLDDIGEKQWLGNFAGYQDRKIQLLVHSSGGIKMSPLHKEEVHAYNFIPIHYGIMVDHPNGQKHLLQPIPESLTSDDKTTTKFKKTTIKGKVVGDAEFEMTIEFRRGTLSIGGRLTSPGKYQPKTVQFGVSTRVIDFYTFQKENTFKDDPEAFLDYISEDSIRLKRIDGKKQKHDYTESKTLATDAINGPGIKEAEVDLKILNSTFIFEASKNSSFTISNHPEAELYKGSLIKWTPTRGKNPKGESRLSIAIK